MNVITSEHYWEYSVALLKYYNYVIISERYSRGMFESYYATVSEHYRLGIFANCNTTAAHLLNLYMLTTRLPEQPQSSSRSSEYQMSLLYRSKTMNIYVVYGG